MINQNLAIITGNVGNDPDLRKTSDGRAVCNFRVATNEYWTDKNGEKHQRTEWHRVAAFGRVAENCVKYLSKGKLVHIVGKLQTNQWEDTNGVTRYATEVVVKEVKFGTQGTRKEGTSKSADEYLGRYGDAQNSFEEFSAED